MAITHAAVKVKGERGLASEWNADHVIEDVDKPKVATTIIVAASNSIDTTRADYVCDATDDQDTINEALAALGTTGGRVQLLEGTFQITNTITIPQANIELCGLGYGSKILATANITMISCNAHHHVAVRDLQIYGRGAGNNSNYGIRFINSDYCEVSGCYITNCGNDGIYTLTSMGYFMAYDNRILSNHSHGMRLVDVTEGLITNSIVSLNLHSGIYVQNCLNNVFSHCNCSENDSANTATWDGITLWGSSWNIIANCRNHDNDGFEINIADAACNKNLVHGNHVRGGAHVGTINDVGTGTTLADNVVA